MGSAQATQQTVDMLAEALAYAERGFRVYPVHWVDRGVCSCKKGAQCPKPGKHPLTEHGVYDATTDPEQIRARWKRWPKANLGVRTGDGLFVGDIDPQHGGNESLAVLEKKYGPLPAGNRVRTGGDGTHYWFEAPKDEKFRSTVNLGGFRGIDIRADGTGAVVPPSLHASGKRYKWLSTGPLEPAPPWVLDLTREKNRNNSGSSQRIDMGRVLEGVPEGQRDDTIFRALCSLRHANVPYSWAQRLASETAGQCKPPYAVALALQKVKEVYERYQPGQRNDPESQADAPWPDPVELPRLLPEVPELPEELVPDPFRSWLKDESERMQTPLEMMAFPAIIAVSIVIGRQCAIYPKRHDHWRVIPNLWGAIVAPSGCMKTPAIQEALKPLGILANKEHERYLRALQDYATESDITKARIAVIQEQLKKAVRENREDQIDALRCELKTLRHKDEISRPRERRYRTNDSTVEKLHELLENSVPGLLVVRDELPGLLHIWDREGRQGERDFFLESWTGDGSFTIDRIGRGTIVSKGLCLSIVGGIQPTRLAGVVTDAIEHTVKDDGFLPRFQLLAYPEIKKEWCNVDREPDNAARSRAYRIFEILSRFDAENLGAHRPEFSTVPALRFDDQAQDLFDDWRLKLETRLRSGEIETPAFLSHMAKFRSFMPSLAVIFHLIAWADSQREDAPWSPIPPVSLESTSCAIEWTDICELHARKVYAIVLRPDLDAAHALAAKIHQGKICNGTTVRDIYRAQWASLRDDTAAYEGLAILGDHGWLRLQSGKGNGPGRPPSEVIVLNPKLGVNEP